MYACALVFCEIEIEIVRVLSVFVVVCERDSAEEKETQRKEEKDREQSFIGLQYFQPLGETTTERMRLSQVLASG